MPLGRPLVPLTLTDEQQDQLSGIARSATLPHALVLAARPRFHLHFTPTYASWLNQVERWFGLLSQRAIKRGSFRSVAGRHGPIDHRQGGTYFYAYFRDSTLGCP